MLRKVMSMGIGAALGLSVMMPGFADGLFQAIAVVERLDISEMVLVAGDGRKYRLSPEWVPEFRQQQSRGQLNKGTLVRIAGHYGISQKGEREPFIEQIQPASR
jgi:hypothetical protein